MKTTQDLINHLQVKEIESGIYEGNSLSIGSPNIYGGQVLGQSLVAAYKSVSDNFLAHSIHAYFLHPGNLELPVRYEVSVLKDGKSFVTRIVKAFQKDLCIYHATVSFHIHEESPFEYQLKPPFLLIPPKWLLTWQDFYKMFHKRLPKTLKNWLELDRPIEFRQVEFLRLFFPNLSYSARKHVWFRFIEPLVDLPQPMMQAMLLYASDYNLLFTALEPHQKINLGKIKMASIDHTMWFHRTIQIDDFYLYRIFAPSTFNARALTHGYMFDKKGNLIASTTQEGLIRKI
ncbi:MAG: thioesterase family protein [Chitinophagales bacterium]|jgi:acyl-CoA thioesterase-2|nr:thioesterase family protein [Chitinophagales bacterium]